MKNLIALMMVAIVFPLQAQTIYNSLPEQVDTTKNYVFYLHGAIIERGDPKPTHPRFGVYDYPAILEALSTDQWVLISEHRKPKTNPQSYSQVVVSQIETLIAKGIAAENITVVGFSKGAGIAIRTSSALNNKAVNFVIMANCGPWYDKRPKLKEFRLIGNILSIYEESDRPGSCQSLVDKSPSVTSFKEVVLNTGKEHGAFFQPLDEWVKPLLSWVRR